MKNVDHKTIRQAFRDHICIRFKVSCDREKKYSRAKRTLIGRIDPGTGEIVPTDGRNKGARSKRKKIPPETDEDKRIRELEVENRQFNLRIAALSKEPDCINKQN